MRLCPKHPQGPHGAPNAADTGEMSQAHSRLGRTCLHCLAVSGRWPSWSCVWAEAQASSPGPRAAEHLQSCRVIVPRHPLPASRLKCQQELLAWVTGKVCNSAACLQIPRSPTTPKGKEMNCGGIFHRSVLFNEHTHAHTNTQCDCPFESAGEAWEGFVNRAVRPGKQRAAWCEHEDSLNATAVEFGVQLVSLVGS